MLISNREALPGRADRPLPGAGRPAERHRRRLHHGDPGAGPQAGGGGRDRRPAAARREGRVLFLLHEVLVPVKDLNLGCPCARDPGPGRVRGTHPRTPTTDSHHPAPQRRHRSKTGEDQHTLIRGSALLHREPGRAARPQPLGPGAVGRELQRRRGRRGRLAGPDRARQRRRRRLLDRIPASVCGCSVSSAVPGQQRTHALGHHGSEHQRPAGPYRGFHAAALLDVMAGPPCLATASARPRCRPARPSWTRRGPRPRAAADRRADHPAGARRPRSTWTASPPPRAPPSC